jgi:hypothetical protein
LDDPFVLDDDRQGASRAVGGICRGRAVGNTPAFADFEPVAGDLDRPEKGRVCLHTGNDSYSANLPVGSRLPAVLPGLAQVYSPIKNSRISVFEDDMWALKGRYLNAVRNTEDLPWAKDDKGKWTITVKAETEPSTLGSAERPVAYSQRDQLISLLDIPDSLTGRGRQELREAYAKYKGVLEAQSNMVKMKRNGTWTLAGKLSMEDLIEIFVSKSAWYDKYMKLFPRALKYPSLKKWLENGDDAPSSLEIFGGDEGQLRQKTMYTFVDLKGLLDKYAKQEKVEEEALRREESSKKKEKRKRKNGEHGDSGPSTKRKRSESLDTVSL